MSEQEKVKIPERCYDCVNCVEKEKTSYMPYRLCTLADRMVYFSPENGWKRMVWCPLAKGTEGR